MELLTVIVTLISVLPLVRAQACANACGATVSGSSSSCAVTIPDAICLCSSRPALDAIGQCIQAACSSDSQAGALAIISSACQPLGSGTALPTSSTVPSTTIRSNSSTRTATSSSSLKTATLSTPVVQTTSNSSSVVGTATTSSSPGTSPAVSKSALSSGKLVGSIVGGIFGGIALFVVLPFCCLRRGKNGKRGHETIMNFTNSTLNHVLGNQHNSG